jgi:carbon starvation protein CstA
VVVLVVTLTAEQLAAVVLAAVDQTTILQVVHQRHQGKVIAAVQERLMHQVARLQQAAAVVLVVLVLVEVAILLALAASVLADIQIGQQ